MARNIILHSENLSAKFLEPVLRQELINSDIKFKIEQTRSLETTILVAIVSAAGTALGALITGILKIKAESGAKNIVIHGGSGRKIEIPADTPIERINEYVQIAKEMDIDRISF